MFPGLKMNYQNEIQNCLDVKKSVSIFSLFLISMICQEIIINTRQRMHRFLQK